MDIRKGCILHFVAHLSPSVVRLRELLDAAVKRRISFVPEDGCPVRAIEAKVRLVLVAHYRPVHLELVIGGLLPYREAALVAHAAIFDDLALVRHLAKVAVPYRFRNVRIRRDFPVGTRESGPGPADIQGSIVLLHIAGKFRRARIAIVIRNQGLDPHRTILGPMSLLAYKVSDRVVMRPFLVPSQAVAFAQEIGSPVDFFPRRILAHVILAVDSGHFAGAFGITDALVLTDKDVHRIAQLVIRGNLPLVNDPGQPVLMHGADIVNRIVKDAVAFDFAPAFAVKVGDTLLFGHLLPLRLCSVACVHHLPERSRIPQGGSAYSDILFQFRHRTPLVLVHVFRIVAHEHLPVMGALLVRHAGSILVARAVACREPERLHPEILPPVATEQGVRNLGFRKEVAPRLVFAHGIAQFPEVGIEGGIGLFDNANLVDIDIHGQVALGIVIEQRANFAFRFAPRALEIEPVLLHQEFDTLALQRFRQGKHYHAILVEIDILHKIHRKPAGRIRIDAGKLHAQQRRREFQRVGGKGASAITVAPDFHVDRPDGIKIIIEQRRLDSDGDKAHMQVESPLQGGPAAFGIDTPFDIPAARSQSDIARGIATGDKEYRHQEGCHQQEHFLNVPHHSSSLSLKHNVCTPG